MNVEMANLFAPIAGLVPFYAVCAAVATFIVHSAFAFAVDRDARRLQHDGFLTVLVGPFMWAVATFIGGPFVAVGYWVVHHSTLATPTERLKPLPAMGDAQNYVRPLALFLLLLLVLGFAFGLFSISIIHH